MKYLLFIPLLFLSNAYAFDVCSFEYTHDFFEYIEKQGIKPTRVSKNHKKFTSVEKKMIYKMVTSQSWRRNDTVAEALLEFGDYYNGKEGYNAGEIQYFTINNIKLVLVHYWPGDNEYGAFFFVNKNNSTRYKAVINDGEIYCK